MTMSTDDAQSEAASVAGSGTASTASSTTTEVTPTSQSQDVSQTEAASATPATPSQSSEPSKKKPKTWEPLAVPGPMEIMQQDIMNNCFIKMGLSGVMGGLAGFAFGLFTASLENAGPSDLGHLDTERPTRVILKEMYQNMKTKSVSYAKGFAYFGALYSFNECVVEKYRAKHDKANPALAGCATGAMMAYSGGPQAMCIGCVSVGAFSLAIEHFLDL